MCLQEHSTSCLPTTESKPCVSQGNPEQEKHLVPNFAWVSSLHCSKTKTEDQKKVRFLWKTKSSTVIRSWSRSVTPRLSETTTVHVLESISSCTSTRTTNTSKGLRLGVTFSRNRESLFNH